MPDQGGLPIETLKSGPLEGGQPAEHAAGTVLRISLDNDQLASANYQCFAEPNLVLGLSAN